jgi:hypothetical protein
MLFVYMNPDLRAYPVPVLSTPPRARNAFGHGTAIARGFVRQARESELFALLEARSPALDSGRLLVASSRFPQASGFLFNFIGLFEREFRRFDYYLGMYDALNDLPSWHQLPSDRGLREVKALLPTPDWHPLECLQAWYDSTGAAPRPDCEGEGLRDFRILAQVAINRVYSQCRELSQEQLERPIANYHCRRAAAGALPPRIAEPMLALDSTRAVRDTARHESELDYNLRLLTAYGFHFRDLGVPPERAGQARQALARRLRQVIETLASRQPTKAQRRALNLGTLAVAVIYYEPPPSWWYAVAGTAQEGGRVMKVPGSPDWLRLNLALRLKGIVSLLTQDPNKFAFGAFAGPDIELRPFTRPTHMITIAPRVGYQWSQGDHVGSASCNAAGTRGDGRDCSQWLLQAATSFIAIERVRLQVTLDYFPRKVEFDDRRYDVQIAVGVQF